MPKPARQLTRRHFLTDSAAMAAGATVAASLPNVASAAATGGAAEFVANWAQCPDRVWAGPEFWSNPLQDWRLANGRLECTNAAGDRNVHVLVRSLAEREGDFTVSVKVSRAGGGSLGGGRGSCGFRIGIRGPLPDYRNGLIFGRGLEAGVTAEGGIFIGSVAEAKGGSVKFGAGDVVLRLTGTPTGGACMVKLAVLDAGGRELGAVSKSVPAAQCVGGLALVNNFAPAGGGGGKAGKAKKAGGGENAPGGTGMFAFADWRISGRKVDAHPERAFGPLLFSQYTLSGGVLKLSVQLPPIGAGDAQTVRLQTRAGADWRNAGEARIHPEARLAAFRIEQWDATRDVPYRLAYTLQFKDGRKEEHHWTGTVRRDPTDAATLSVLDVSCNIQSAFPNPGYVASSAKLNPDFIAFTGDQFYESSGGYGIIRTPTDKAMLDYLRKWYLHGWTWRELMRDRPSISIPDDHDVYQGNIWGEGGRAQGATQEGGGYIMPAEWVNVVYRTQTAHHPDAYDPTPSLQNIIQYYGPLTYGRVSFAIVADRQYKSGPEGKVPATGGRADHVKDPKFDPKVADVPGLVLLGAKQEEFLEKWVRDWRGAEMKAVISQTIFTSFPTTHGGERAVLRADYDSNGWPQTPRNRALRTIRKAFAFHLAGDQHIPGVIHYGVDTHRDAGIGFAGPAANCGYTRWFEPEKTPWLKPAQPGLTGDFVDHFGNPMTVLAVKNGAIQARGADLIEVLEEKSSGIGLVTFDKRRRRIRIDCWPYRADVTRSDTQWAGWPLELDVRDNYARKAAAHLPTLEISGVRQPLIEVVADAGGELVYALRIAESRFQPPVFAAGRYTVRVSDPDTGKAKELRGLDTKDSGKTVKAAV